MTARNVLYNLPMRLGGCVALVLLSSCVPSQSSVFRPVDRDVRLRVGADVTWSGSPDAKTQTAIRDLLGKPIDASSAVRIALAQNRRLQARYDGLGIAASQIADATVLGATSVDANYKFASGGGRGGETEITVVQDLLSLLQIGQRRGAANAMLGAAQARAVEATVELVADVEIAFHDSVAAMQDLELVTHAFEAADAAATLVERQHAAGNTSDLELVREQEQRERLRVEVKRATQRAEERHARLGGLLGLTAAQPAWTTVATLPALPAAAPALDQLEHDVLAQSLESSALRLDARAAQSRHRFAVVRAFLPEIGAGVAAARRDGGGWEIGPAVRLGIPLFDQQQGPRARARAEEQRARSELAATETELRAGVLEAGSRLARAFEEAHQLADVVVPLRKRVLAETVLQYNAMNANTFELLMAKRDMIEIGRQSIDATRRYWNAASEVTALQRGGHVSTRAEPEGEPTP